jgi:phage gpG-like protein
MLSISVQGVQATVRRLLKVGDAAKNPKPALQAMEKALASEQEKVFDKEGEAPGFPGWRPLNPTYSARKVKDGFRGKILVRSGKLRMSVSNAQDSNFVSRIRPQSIEVGTRLNHANFHQYGTKNMPARSVIRVTANMRAIAKKTLADWIRKWI